MRRAVSVERGGYLQPPHLAFYLAGFCVAPNAAGFLFHLFEPVLLYAEVATPTYRPP